jgi:hypothetical protein
VLSGRKRISAQAGLSEAMPDDFLRLHGGTEMMNDKTRDARFTWNLEDVEFCPNEDPNFKGIPGLQTPAEKALALRNLLPHLSPEKRAETIKKISELEQKAKTQL